MFGLIPQLLEYFLDEEGNSNGKSILDFILEKTDEFFDIVIAFYSPIFDVLLNIFQTVYVNLFGNFTDFILDLINRQSVDFTTRGQVFVDSFFSKINFSSSDFTENFIFWVIGLFLFAFAAKLFFRVAFGLFKTILEVIF